MMAKKNPSKSSNSTATIGYEAKLWLTVDTLRNNMDAARVYECFLTRFASAEGKNGGQFYAPSSRSTNPTTSSHR